MEKVTSFLMFQDGKAEEAMNYYTFLIEDAQITSNFSKRFYATDGVLYSSIFYKADNFKD